jgi:hypothetical protein
MSVSSPTKSIGKASGSPAIKVIMWLFVAAGCVMTVRQWWNGEQWFLLEFLDWLWSWSLEISEAFRS